MDKTTRSPRRDAPSRLRLSSAGYLLVGMLLGSVVSTITITYTLFASQWTG